MQFQPSAPSNPCPQTIAPYILCVLATYHENGRVATLQSIVDDVGVRRADVRTTLTALHEQGLVDVLRMKLTLQGFALAMALREVRLPPLRREAGAGEAAA